MMRERERRERERVRVRKRESIVVRSGMLRHLDWTFTKQLSSKRRTEPLF